MRHRPCWSAVAATALALALFPSSPASAAAPAPAAPSSPAPDPAPADDRGSWQVSDTGVDRYTVSWTSPTELPVGDARPEILADGVVAGVPTLDPDGRTVEVTVTSPTLPDVAAFDVVLSGRTLDSAAAAPPVEPAPYVVPAQVTELPEAADPGVPGPHETRTTDYDLPSVELPDISRRAEMLGHVVEPTDATADSPLVVFLHGRHSPCYRPGAPAPLGIDSRAAVTEDWRCPGRSEPIPSHLGYDYVQQLLASQGYVTVSISANAINALDYDAPDGGATARATLIRKHLEAWTDFVAAGTYTADLSNVVLVGHSRGGEGANRASLDLGTDATYGVSGQVLIGPTDFGFQAAPSTPTVTLLPYCDGDVSDLQGQNFTDASRDLTDQLAFHSSVLVMGANHNFFNTEWTPGLSVAPSNDDWYSRDPTRTCGSESSIRLSEQGQQDVGSAYIAGAVHLFADGDQDVLPMYDGSAVSVPSAGNADVRSHAIGGGLETRRPFVDAELAATATASSRFCVGQAFSPKPLACESEIDATRTPHWPAAYFPGPALRRGWEVSWSEAGRTSGIVLDEAWDLTGMSDLDLRTIVQPGNGPATLHVRLADAHGNSATLVPEGDGILSPLPGGAPSLAKRWGQVLRVSLDDIEFLDLAEVTSVAVVSNGPAGRVWVLDLVAHPAAGLSPAPTPTVSTISVGTVTRTEGNGRDEVTIKVPYTVEGGPLAADARVRMLVAEDVFYATDGATAVTIPAGTTSGTLSVPFQPNRVDDYPRRHWVVAVYPVGGIATNHYLGGATVIDDDPSPVATIEPARTRIREGQTARWKVTLSGRTSYPVEFQATPIRGGGKGKRLTVGDLTEEFREGYLYPIPPLRRALYTTDLAVYNAAAPGRIRSSLTIPTVARPGEQGPRSITMRFRFFNGIRVVDRTHTIIVTD